MRIAERTRAPSIAHCKRSIGAREFLVWKAWLATEGQRPTPLMFYLAQIALEVRRLRWLQAGLDPADVGLEDMMLDFGGEERQPARADGFADMSPEELRGFKALRLAQLGVPYEDIKKWTK